VQPWCNLQFQGTQAMLLIGLLWFSKFAHPRCRVAPPLHVTHKKKDGAYENIHHLNIYGTTVSPTSNRMVFWFSESQGVQLHTLDVG